jgi:hypothetical protein
MTVWHWALIALAAWVVLGILVTFGLAAVLGHLSQKLSAFEHDWASAPLTRDRPADQVHVAERVEDEEAIVAAGRM